MPLGVRALGSFRLGEPLAKTTLTHAEYLDGIADLVAAGFTRAQAEQIMGGPRKPYQSGADVATATLYPSLAGYADARDIIRGTSCGHYQIALNGYGVLPYWKSASWTQILNEPDTLTFDYPADADYAANLLRPNTISILDAYGHTVQILQLTDIIPNAARSGDGVTIKVSARGYLGQLSDEYVTYYSATGTIPAHVAALMSQFQTADIAFSVGDVYDPIAGATVTVSFADKSLLDCIKELHKLTGSKGQYAVTPSRQFVWVERLGSAKAVDIALGFNLRSLERRPDMAEFASCLYVYGAGLSPAERLVSYRESATAIAAYGKVIRRLTLENVTVQADLDAYADELIDVVSVPTIEYSVAAADLAYIDAGEAFTIGGSAHIQDVDLGVDTTQDVVNIRRSLDSPLDITFGFAKREKNLASLLKSLSDRIAALETRDDAARINDGIFSGEIENIPRTDWDTPRTNDFAVTGLAPDSSLGYYAPDSGGTQTLVPLANLSDVPVGATSLPSALGDPASAGIDTNEYSNKDHAHDDTQLRSDLEDYADAAAAAVVVPVGSTATPEAVSTTASAGTDSGAYSNANHKHSPWIYGGRTFSVANYAALASPPSGITFADGDIGYAQDLDNFYQRRNGAWRIAGIFESTTAPASIGEADGDLWYEPTADTHYARRNAQWRFTQTWQVASYAALATAPTGVTVTDGDRAYVADVDVDLVRRNGVWRLTNTLSVANFAALASAPANVTIADGDEAYCEDLDNKYVRRNGAWRIAHKFRQATKPASIGETYGDHWEDTDIGVEYMLIASIGGDYWNPVTHVAAKVMV